MRPFISRLALPLIVVAIGSVLPGCGSSSKDSAAVPPGSTVSPNASCPFDGSTASQSQPGASGQTQLNKVTPSPSGCIDNVTLGFSPTLAPSVSAYEKPAPTGGGAVLVVTLQHATLGGGLKTGTTHPTNLSYVSQVQVSSASGTVTIRATLDKERPFLVSSTTVPPQLTLAVG